MTRRLIGSSLWMLPVAIFALFLFSSCGDDETTTQPSTTGGIRGKITDAVNGEPVAGVTVTTNPPTQSVTTDAEGSFSISSVIPTRYTVLASRTGYTSASVEVQVSAGAFSTADIQIRGDGKTEALEFDGKDDMVVVPDSPDLDLSGSGFTLEFYAYAHTFRSGADRWNSVLGHGPDNSELDFLLGFESSKPMFYVRSYEAGMVGKTILKVNEWYHIAAVQDVAENKLLIYVNGVLDSESTLKGSPVSTTADFFIGARESNGTGKGAHFFDGILHEVRVWNRARTAEEINSTMKKSLQGTESGLVGYWQLNDGVGEAAADNSGNNDAGMLKGGPVWIEVESPLQ